MFSSLPKETCSHQFQRFCRSAGLEGFKLHSLRHTFATELVDRGVDILVLSKLMGHSQINASMIYAKAGEALKRRAIEKLEDESHDGHKLVTIDSLSPPIEDDPKKEK